MLSVVIPVFNEEESLRAFYRELIQVIPSLARSYEIIFVDDGSTDGSLEILKQFEKKNRNVRIFSLRKNQGKSEALSLGFEKAKGDFIVTMDADLQDKPSEISKLLKKIKEGFALVSGWRRNRQDHFSKIIASNLFNFLVRTFWRLNLHDYNCGLKVYRKNVAKSLNLYGGLHRFIPLLVYQQGFTVAEQEIIHRERKYGRSKYGFSKVWSDLPDIFTMLFLSKYGQRPMHFFGTVGLVLFLLGTIILSYLTLLRLQGETIGRRPLLFLGMLLTIAGLQVFFSGFLADLIINTSRKNDEKTLTKYSSDV